MVPREWEQAGAVVDRLWDQHPAGSFNSVRDNVEVVVWFEYPDGPDARDFVSGTGPTYVAALIDLGRKWAQEGDDAQ